LTRAFTGGAKPTDAAEAGSQLPCNAGRHTERAEIVDDETLPR
jgi:hypothetical protein